MRSATRFHPCLSKSMSKPSTLITVQLHLKPQTAIMFGQMVYLSNSFSLRSEITTPRETVANKIVASIKFENNPETLKRTAKITAVTQLKMYATTAVFSGEAFGAHLPALIPTASFDFYYFS